MNNFEWLNDTSRTILQRGYLRDGIDPIKRIRRICDYAESINKIEGFADELFNYCSRGWISFSSPIWANFGADRGLPISCYSSYMDDTMEGILYTASEIGMMSKHGGGTSVYIGNVRERGSEISSGGNADGIFHWSGLISSIIERCKQSETRRGACAVYTDIFHKDIKEFLTIGVKESKIQNLQSGVCVPNWWIEEMKNGDREKREIWALVLKTRSEIGFPFLFFTDNVNNGKSTPKWYGDGTDYKINSSNLCTEIMQSTTKDESFVCCISSVNILDFDEQKKTNIFKTMTVFLDTVYSDFIRLAKEIPFMDRAVRFAENHRALGLGVLGYHSHLQLNNIPFESWEAKTKNNEIFSFIDKETLEASQWMAENFGEPSLLKGEGVRNSTRIAIAPTKTSSCILGQVSLGIEPLISNYYVKNIAKSTFVLKNPILTTLLKSMNKDIKNVWEQIKKDNGSVKNLDFLTDHQKNVFKTWEEISQMEVIQQAAQRQQYIDNAQSINLRIHPNTSAKDLNTLTLTAHELGIKSLYYQYSKSAAQEYSLKMEQGCVACEG